MGAVTVHVFDFAHCKLIEVFFKNLPVQNSID